jgi:hypothetical protein
MAYFQDNRSRKASSLKVLYLFFWIFILGEILGLSLNFFKKHLKYSFSNLISNALQRGELIGTVRSARFSEDEYRIIFYRT